MNPQYEVRPKISFIDGTMKFLTCKDHYWGYDCMMIHACRWKRHSPSDQHDKTSQVVTQSINVRKGKAILYSTEFQLM